MISIYFVAGTRLSGGSGGVRLAGSTATLGNMGIWNIDLLPGRAHTAQLECLECLPAACMEAWKFGSLEVWKFGSMQLGNLGTWELQRDGRTDGRTTRGRVFYSKHPDITQTDPCIHISAEYNIAFPRTASCPPGTAGAGWQLRNVRCTIPTHHSSPCGVQLPSIKMG
jgi:hypothetical protein